MISIRNEIKEIEEGKYSKDNNPVKKAPHTLGMALTDPWELPYSRNIAGFPDGGDFDSKYWPPVTKIDDAYGDRNLICTCPDIKDFD